MFRTTRPHTNRLAGAMVFGAVIATAVTTGASSAQVTTPTTDLETTALQISGSAIPAGGVIPTDRALTPVRLTTSDPDTATNDGLVLNGAVPEIRSRKPRFVVPAVPAEQATFRINGVTVATSVPDFRAVTLQTDQGPLPAVLFTAGGASYVLLRFGAPVGEVTRTVASSTVGTATISSLLTVPNGLLPIGSQPRPGTMFEQNGFGSTLLSSQTVRRTVYDADTIRGNADSVSEELVVADNGATIWTPPTEVLATVTLTNGTNVALQGLRYEQFFSYGQVITTWAFDTAALAAAGATLAEVTGVVSSAPADHDLTWQELGFETR